jgi:hypothetical protein
MGAEVELDWPFSLQLKFHRLAMPRAARPITKAENDHWVRLIRKTIDKNWVILPSRFRRSPDSIPANSRIAGNTNSCGFSLASAKSCCASLRSDDINGSSLGKHCSEEKVVLKVSHFNEYFS